jgi:polyphosphate kinase
MPDNMLKKLVGVFNLRSANMIAGGNYHNLKDFSTLPVNHHHLVYPEQIPLEYKFRKEQFSLLKEVDNNDVMLHTP